MSNRILQLDFLKGILIINVIMIHLIYLGECHPDFKRFLLLFTTPSFFVISGYLAHVNKPTRLFSKKVFWWLVPYIIMEGAYIVMASLLPIKEHIDQLSLAVFLDHLFLSPLGPYWYIHDLIVCYVGYFSLHKALTAKRLWLIIPYIIIMIILALSVPKYTSLQSVLFFSAGIIIKHSTDNFVKFFHPSWIALPILAILYIFHDDVKMIDLIRNVIISYIAMSSLLFVYSYLPKSSSISSIWLGATHLPSFFFHRCSPSSPSVLCLFSHSTLPPSSSRWYQSPSASWAVSPSPTYWTSADARPISSEKSSISSCKTASQRTLDICHAIVWRPLDNRLATARRLFGGRQQIFRQMPKDLRA